MTSQPSVRLIADFNADVFARYLTNTLRPAPRLEVTPFGQVHQSLAAERPADDGSTIVWARAEAAIASFGRAAELEDVRHEDVLAEVDAFADQLIRYSKSVRHLFVCAWTTAPGRRGYGLLDYRHGLGIASLVARMNIRLAERLSESLNVHILDTERWIREAGPKAPAPKMWYAGKVPFGNAVFEQAALDVAAALEGIAGTSRRLIVLDLDNTLWGGVVGENGAEGVTLGGHDHVGEAFVDFQRGLLALRRRGIQLAVVSKNDEPVAMDAIDRHPEMVLRRADLAGWRINWNDKARNVAELVAELNLGLASAVFIDDSAIERARVRETFPEILVPEWPSDPAQYRAALEALRCFDVPAISDEDRQRGSMYAAERERKASFERVGSLDDWLATLDIRVEAEPLSPANLKRAAQLFNKTNQMNMSTRRLTEQELVAWAAEPSRRLWTLTVSDRFGASGLTGIVSVEMDGETARLTDFLLSCRVMGRRVEESMLFLAESFAHAKGAREMVADFVPTKRNAPCLQFFEASGMERRGEHRFVRPLVEEPQAPACVTLVDESATAV